MKSPVNWSSTIHTIQPRKKTRLINKSQRDPFKSHVVFINPKIKLRNFFYSPDKSIYHKRHYGNNSTRHLLLCLRTFGIFRADDLILCSSIFTLFNLIYKMDSQSDTKITLYPIENVWQMLQLKAFCYIPLHFKFFTTNNFPFLP